MVEKNARTILATRGRNYKLKTDSFIDPFLTGFRRIRRIFCGPLFKSQFTF